jgi:pimeloyl-ACP methyl ester carboxylesterase
MVSVYCHGFASGSKSRKAEGFRSAFRARGFELAAPDLDGGDFEHLTISGQLRVIERTIAGLQDLGWGIALIGSSMGGYLAALYAASHDEVSRLVLLAPAFDFARRWETRWPEAPHGGKRPELEVYHYADQRLRHVHHGLIEDALGYPPAPRFAQPALIFHGVKDDTVPIETSRAFAAANPNARLIELDSGHELLDVLDSIIQESLDFLAP